MSVQVRRRREAAAFLSTYVGAQGELLVDTTNNRVQVHDGATVGGWPAAKLGEVVTNTRTAVADAAYAAQSSDRTIAFTALTAARTVTLPAAASYPTGTRLAVLDETGACSASLAITVAATGSDRINGLSAVALVTPYGVLAFQCNGAGKWTITDQTAVANRKTFLDVAKASSQSISSGAFTRIVFQTINQDADSNWNASNNWYVCPRAGIYQITGTIRVIDGTAPGSTYSCGVYTNEVDGPWFLWTDVGPSPASRSTYSYSRLSFQNAGDALRMFAYSDATNGVTFNAAGLQICLVSDAV